MQNLFKLCPTPLILKLATLWGLGYKKAPGTWGSIAGLIFYSLFFYSLSFLSYTLILLFLVYASIQICDEAERRLNQKDAQCIILDEAVAMPICFFGFDPARVSSNVWIIMLLGLGLFRFFDILKPLGIKRIQNLPGGLGVVLDDVAAAACTAVCLQVLITILF
jgi:phosphatidylglycerophosphatase A